MKISLKRRYGQHLLRDTGILDRLLRFLDPTPDDIFLEIGAGLGALSERLAPKVSRLIAVEIDVDCIHPLRVTLSDHPTATVVHGDILRLDIAELVAQRLGRQKGLRIAGNLPYNIASAIIERLLALSTAIQDMTFLVQLEVARRITARPGTREYGYYSVLCQHLSEVKIGFRVPPECFVPRPKVISAVIAFRPLVRDRKPDLEKIFVVLAKAAFSHRRKTLANSLTQHPTIGPVADALLAKARIDGGRRAEQLTVHEYEHLAHVYYSEFVQ